MVDKSNKILISSLSSLTCALLITALILLINKDIFNKL